MTGLHYRLTRPPHKPLATSSITTLLLQQTESEPMASCVEAPDTSGYPQKGYEDAFASNPKKAVPRY